MLSESGNIFTDFTPLTYLNYYEITIFQSIHLSDGVYYRFKFFRFRVNALQHNGNYVLKSLLIQTWRPRTLGSLPTLDLQRCKSNSNSPCDGGRKRFAIRFKIIYYRKEFSFVRYQSIWGIASDTLFITDTNGYLHK